jgi:hypothetical protein
MSVQRKKARSCGKCGNKKNLTLHHVLPRRWFRDCQIHVTLCRECHNKVEIIIHRLEKKREKRLSLCEYFYLLINFLLLEEYFPEEEIESSHDIILENPEVARKKNGHLIAFLKKTINYPEVENCFLKEIIFLCENL